MNTNQCKSKNENLHCDEPHQQYIENASHHIDKIGGFHRGFDLEKWLAAEAKIDQLLTEK
ncbi:MAG: hypothetical protein RQ936_08215 [Gammaproteobacteria bacterium]|nr:hypothetical protein [Gammaproteobacteria bacterium]